MSDGTFSSHGSFLKQINKNEDIQEKPQSQITAFPRYRKKNMHGTKQLQDTTAQVTITDIQNPAIDELPGNAQHKQRYRRLTNLYPVDSSTFRFGPVNFNKRSVLLFLIAYCGV